AAGVGTGVLPRPAVQQEPLLPRVRARGAVLLRVRPLRPGADEGDARRRARDHAVVRGVSAGTGGGDRHVADRGGRMSAAEERVARADAIEVEDTDWGRLEWMVAGRLGNSDTMTVGRCSIDPG